jgi:MOSC domain-containing protein YiiM
MKLLSVNIAAPRLVEFNGQATTTGIFKEPIAGRVHVTKLTIEGDHQVDKRYHGGFNKAVYAYPSEHYPAWEDFLTTKLSPGQFGENLTVEGLLEENVHLGDRLRIGTALLEVTQPRVPCFKLGIKMLMPSFPKWFLKSGKLGFYLRVLEEGEFGVGDAIELVHQDDERISIRELWQLAYGDAFDAERIAQILKRETLAGEWTKPLREKLMG